MNISAHPFFAAYNSDKMNILVYKFAPMCEYFSSMESEHEISGSNVMCGLHLIKSRKLHLIKFLCQFTFPPTLEDNVCFLTNTLNQKIFSLSK